MICFQAEIAPNHVGTECDTLSNHPHTCWPTCQSKSKATLYSQHCKSSAILLLSLITNLHQITLLHTKLPRHHVSIVCLVTAYVPVQIDSHTVEPTLNSSAMMKQEKIRNTTGHPPRAMM